MPARIVVATHDDPVFALPAWAAAVPSLRDAGHEVVEIAVVPGHLARHRGIAVPLWYLRVFGAGDFARLAAYSLIRRMRLAAEGTGPWGVRRWDDFRRHGIPVSRYAHANAPELVSSVSKRNVDALLVTVDDILKPDILAAPSQGCVNKHAALLPSCRGLFPFFWALLKDQPLGVTYHRVDAGIDTGAILLQKRCDESLRRASMLSFYRSVFRAFPAEMTAAVSALLAGEARVAPAGVPASYFGLPGPEDAVAFRAAGHRVSDWDDIAEALA